MGQILGHDLVTSECLGYLPRHALIVGRDTLVRRATCISLIFRSSHRYTTRTATRSLNLASDSCARCHRSIVRPIAPQSSPHSSHTGPSWSPQTAHASSVIDLSCAPQWQERGRLTRYCDRPNAPLSNGLQRGDRRE